MTNYTFHLAAAASFPNSDNQVGGGKKSYFTIVCEQLKFFDTRQKNLQCANSRPVTPCGSVAGEINNGNDGNRREKKAKKNL